MNDRIPLKIWISPRLYRLEVKVFFDTLQDLVLNPAGKHQSDCQSTNVGALLEGATISDLDSLTNLDSMHWNHPQGVSHASQR